MRRIGKSNNERHWLGKREMRSHWRSFCFSEEDKKENTSASVSYSREREIGAEIEGERREGKRNAAKRNETLWERERVCVLCEREKEKKLKLKDSHRRVLKRKECQCSYVWLFFPFFSSSIHHVSFSILYPFPIFSFLLFFSNQSDTALSCHRYGVIR